MDIDPLNSPQRKHGTSLDQGGTPSLGQESSGSKIARLSTRVHVLDGSPKSASCQR